MRAKTKAARRPQAEPLSPPPTDQVHEVTVELHHHIFELAQWAYRYEQDEDNELDRLHEGRTFEQFLADCVEEGLELPVTRWRHQTAG